MNTFRILFLSIALLLISCAQNNKSNNENINSKGDTILNDSIYKDNPVDTNSITNQETQERNLRFLFYANGGLIGYFNDGTITGCPRCDLMTENITVLYNKEPYSNFKVENGFLISELNDSILIHSMTKREWAIIEYENQIDNPKSKLADEFINGYVKNIMKMNEALEIIEWVNSNNLSTNSFKSNLTQIINQAYEKEPDYGLGFDPVLDGNDFPDDGFQLDMIKPNSNFLIFSGIGWEEYKVMVKVEKVDNQWLVDGCGIVNIPSSEQIKK
ncbi:MAG: hypothetical protein ACK5IC_10730 [Moheibacter sp.]